MNKTNDDLSQWESPIRCVNSGYYKRKDCEEYFYLLGFMVNNLSISNDVCIRLYQEYDFDNYKTSSTKIIQKPLYDAIQNKLKNTLKAVVEEKKAEEESVRKLKQLYNEFFLKYKIKADIQHDMVEAKKEFEELLNLELFRYVFLSRNFLKHLLQFHLIGETDNEDYWDIVSILCRRYQPFKNTNSMVNNLLTSLDTRYEELCTKREVVSLGYDKIRTTTYPVNFLDGIPKMFLDTLSKIDIALTKKTKELSFSQTVLVSTLSLTRVFNIIDIAQKSPTFKKIYYLKEPILNIAKYFSGQKIKDSDKIFSFYKFLCSDLSNDFLYNKNFTIFSSYEQTIIKNLGDLIRTYYSFIDFEFFEKIKVKGSMNGFILFPLICLIRYVDNVFYNSDENKFVVSTEKLINEEVKRVFDDVTFTLKNEYDDKRILNYAKLDIFMNQNL